MLKSLEEQLVLQSELILQKSMLYSNNNQALALTRIARAVFWIAKKYRRLASKERALVLFYSKLEKLSVTKNEKFPSDNVEDVIVYTLNRYRAFRKKMNIFLLLVAVLSFLIVVSVLVTQNYIFPTLNTTTSDDPYPTTATNSQGNVVLPVVGEVTMKDTKTILGDKKIVAFENYHNLSRLLNKKTTIDTPQDELSLLERLCDSVIAPDGTAYMVYNNVVKEDDSNITFTLYRMEVDGWTEVAIGEAQGCYYENAIVEQYYASRINLVSDKDSNIYVLVLLDDCVTIYKYDAKIGVFKKCDSTLPCMKPMNEPTFTIYYDEHAGEKGRIYIGYWKQYKLGFAYYDIAKDGFEIITENIGTVMEKYAIFCVKNETIYAVTQGNDSGKRILTYYQIESDGTFIKNRLFTSKGSWDIESEDIYNRKVGSGGIHVDETGVIHIVASHFDGGMHVDCSTYLVHYMIDTNGNVTKQELPRHYYNDYTGADRFARYDPICALFFVGKKGEMYYIESYDSTENLLVVCELNQEICGESRCVDVIELPDNISGDRIRINQGAVVFYSDAQHILFFKLNFQN